VTIRVRDTSLATQTDAQGQFHIPSAPVGTAKLIVDGSTANRPGSWPDLEFDLTTIAGRDNTLNMPIFLLPLDLAHGLQIDETHGATLTLPAIPGFSLEIAPGSVTFPGGSKSGVVSVTLVHSDKVPMVPNFGQQPRFIVTIQPAGARFDPPARLILPNVEGLAPGEVTEFYSFDHDLGHFVSIGPATVSDDGMTISSNRGVGIVKAGWHCGGNPNSSGTPHNCPPCQRCVNGHCEMDPNAGPNCFSVKIDQPTQGQMLDITAEPKMPDVHARARIVGLDPDPTAQTTFTWKTQISLKSVECDSRVHASREITHPDINATAVGSDYQPQFQVVRGGHLTMTASATINGNTAQDVTKDVILRGTNPARSDIQGALPHNALRQIACQESGQRQFAAAPDGGMNKCPLFSSDHLGGVGVMQITNPAPTFDQHWDWHTNVAAGISKFNSTTSAAQGYSQQLARSQGFMSLVTAYNARRSQSHLAPLTIQIPALTQGNFDNDFEQRERDAIRGYNGFGGPRFLGLVLHEYRLVLDGDGYLVLTVDEAHRQGTAQWEQVPVTARGSFGEPNYVALVVGRTPSCQ
jgi:hypothetical protein